MMQAGYGLFVLTLRKRGKTLPFKTSKQKHPKKSSIV
jgi:hypothetical protein